MIEIRPIAEQIRKAGESAASYSHKLSQLGAVPPRMVIVRGEWELPPGEKVRLSQAQTYLEILQAKFHTLERSAKIKQLGGKPEERSFPVEFTVEEAPEILAAFKAHGELISAQLSAVEHPKDDYYSKLFQALLTGTPAAPPVAALPTGADARAALVKQLGAAGHAIADRAAATFFKTANPLTK